MAETALKFGPEWLRALSHPNPGTNNPNNQPIIPNFMGNPPKYKLADYRYGREEMLALFDRNSKMPDSIKDLTMISSEKCQLPLAFVTMSDDEQRMWARSVNSEGLTRIGKGGGPAPTSVGVRGRGGSVDRGRGRGRGTGAFYQRGSSFDDLDGPPGGLTRARGFDRTTSSGDRPEVFWEDRERRPFERPFPNRTEENGIAGRKEISRGGGAPDGWRGSSREPEKGREDENGWRSVGRGSEKWNGTTGKSWRSDKEEWERGALREGESLGTIRNGPSNRGSHHSKRSSSQIWDDDTGDQLPEWSREDDCDAEQVGTFDSAGAFMETKEERISSSHQRRTSNENEEFGAPNDGVGTTDKGDGDKVKKQPQKVVETEEIGGRKNSSTNRANSITPPTELNATTIITTPITEPPRTQNSTREEPIKTVRGNNISDTAAAAALQHQQMMQQLQLQQRQLSQPNASRQTRSSASPDNDISRAMLEASLKPTPGMQGLPKQQLQQPNMVFNNIRGISEKMVPPTTTTTTTTRSNDLIPGDKTSDDDNFALLEKAAENMMAKWTAEEEQRSVVHVASQNVEKVAVLPLHHEDAYKWFYRDPQSQVQGPFTSQEMLEWFSSGYFTMGLMVRRGCDERFCQLGDLIRSWGESVPFTHGASPPPPLRAQPSSVNVPSPHQPQSSQGLGVPSVNMPPHPTPVVNPQQQAPQSNNPQSPEHEQQMRLMILHQQLIQQQLLYKQHFQVQNLLGHLKQEENFTNLSPQQQQQVLLQHLIAQQQLQRAAPAGMTDLPSLPDPLAQLQLPLLGLTLPPLIGGENTSLWNLPPNQSVPNPPTMPFPMGAAAPNQPKNPGNSIWDIEVPNKELEAQRQASRERKEKEEAEEQQRRMKEAAEEERKKQQAIEEQRRRIAEQEEKRRQEEEMQRKRREEEEEKRRQEEKKRAEEEQRRKEEQLRQLEEKLNAIRLAEEQRVKQEEMLKKKMEEDMFKKQKEEGLLQKKRLEELARKEQMERAAEERRREEEKREIEKKIKQEIERQKEHERERREAERRSHQMELERQQQEALKKLQEQQKAKNQLPPWLLNNDPAEESNTLSLAQIQQLEKQHLAMEREEKKKFIQMEREREMRQAQAANQQMKNAMFSWAQNFKAAEPAPVKTLLEIQQEEAERLAREEKKQPKPVQNILTQSNSGVWNNAASNLSWAASNREGGGGGWTQIESQNSSSSRGFWDDAVTNVAHSEPPAPVVKQSKTATKPGSESAFPALAKPPAQTSNTGSSNKAKNIRAKKDEETVMKLFETHKLKNNDDFTQWCTKSLASMDSSVDIPTFIAFLKDVESPYEVHDYVKSYLGEGKDAREFAKQFLERRSKLKNQTKTSMEEENMWGPAPAITPTLTKTQQQIHADFEANQFTTVGGGGGGGANGANKTKKKKTKKMQKLDMSLLGFTVQADPDRINVGEIDRLDAI